MRPNLAHFLSPKSVAVVGASDERLYSRNLLANLRTHGYPERAVYRVNPRRAFVGGIACFPSLAALPSVPEVAVLLVSRQRALEIAREVSTLAIPAMVVIADGFAEEDAAGARLQDELAALAASARTTLLGPNTLGLLAPGSGAALWCGGPLRRPVASGGIGLVTQSSGMLNLVMAIAAQRRLGVRAAFSVGNAAQVGFPEIVDAFAADPAVSVIGAVVESVDRPSALLEALLAAQRLAKPVVALKIGRSELGRKNAAAHTGRLASPQEGWRALFSRTGVSVVEDLDDLLATIALFDGVGSLAGSGAKAGVALATISGGDTSLVCDIAAEEDLPLAELSAPTRAALRRRLAKEQLLGNPLDLQNTRTERPDVFFACLQELCSDRSVQLLALRLTNMTDSPGPDHEHLYGQVFELARGAGVVPVVMTRAAESFDDGWWSLFARLGAPLIVSYRSAIRALARVARRRSGTAGEGSPPSAVPRHSSTGEATATLRPAGQAETRRLLEAAGVRFVESRLAASEEEAVAAAAEIGYPVVLKAVVPGLVHKSDAGGVILDVADGDQVRSACNKLRAALEAEDVLRFEVQPMVRGGVEMILGMTRDPTWGPLIAVGAGGIFTELLADVRFELPPISMDRALDLLSALRIWPLLRGSRGSPPADAEALARLVARFSDAMALSDPGLIAVDINPLIVGAPGSGAVAVDAVAMLAGESPGGR